LNYYLFDIARLRASSYILFLSALNMGCSCSYLIPIFKILLAYLSPISAILSSRVWRV